MRSNRRPFARPYGLAVAVATLVAPAAASAAEPDAEGGDAASLDEVVVSATRDETEVSKLARSVTVVTREQIEQQATADRNLSTILANTVPGIGPTTESVTNFGQSLRGRNFLVLIDGVPQSTPLRDVFADLNSISPASVERIEVVRGGTAAYGFGAEGGLINIITKKPSDEPVAGYSQAGASVSTEETDDSADYETEHQVSGTQGDVDYLVGGSYVERGGRFDSEGRRIPPNPQASQPGLADTEEWSLLAKSGLELGGDQRIDLMINHLDNEQDTDFTFGAAGVTLASDPTPNSKRTPAIPIADATGGTAIETPQSETTVGQVTYTHRDLSGSQLRVNAYAGDRSIVFPRFGTFKQSETESQKQGVRSTVTTPLALGGTTTTLTWGFDYLADETDSNFFGTGATDTVPEMRQDAYAGFAEVEQPLGSVGLVRGGLRYETITVEADTVASNRFGNRVEGGELDYDETLFNASAVFYLSQTWETFTSYSQGFSIADLGRTIRGLGPTSGGAVLQVDGLESEAKKVDNYELGLRHRGRALQGSLVAFYSESENGATFNPDLSLAKVDEQVWGVEAALDYRASDDVGVGGTFAWTEGERDPENGDEEELPNTRVQPEKLTLYVEYSPMAGWDNRLQSVTIGDRETNSTQFGNGDVDGYTTLDWIAKFGVGPGDLEVSLTNLTNEDYYPAANQAYDANYAYAKAPGRRLGVSYAVDW